MGNKMVKFRVTPGENEQIDAVIKVHQETRSVFHGFVIDECNKPIKNAIVKLLIEDCNSKHLQPAMHTFTDENGEFALGPLCAHVKYVIKVWNNNVKTRQLVIKPEECEDECIKGKSIGEKVVYENVSAYNKKSSDKGKKSNINRYDGCHAKVKPRIIMSNSKKF